MNTHFVTKVLLSNMHRVIMVALVLVLLFSMMPTGKASAYTVTQVSGRAGQMVLPVINLVPDGYGGWYFRGNTTTNVYRSPSITGTQIIQVTYVIQRWDGRQWVAITASKLPAQVVGVNQYARFAAPNIWPQFVRGYHRFAWTVDWRNSSGQLIAQSVVFTSKATEYSCSSRLCTIYTDGSVYLNGLFSN